MFQGLPNAILGTLAPDGGPGACKPLKAGSACIPLGSRGLAPRSPLRFTEISIATGVPQCHGIVKLELNIVKLLDIQAKPCMTTATRWHG